MALANLHRIAEDTSDRLVLVKRTLGVFILAGFFGLITLSLGFGAAMAWDSGPWFIGPAGSVLALLSLWACVASLCAGLRPAERLVFDRNTGRIEFQRARKAASFCVPFELAEFVELRHERRSGGGPRGTRHTDVYLLYLVLKGGDEFRLEQSGDRHWLTHLALKIGSICSLEVSDAVDGQRRKSTGRAPEGIDFEWPHARLPGLPKYVASSTHGRTRVYRWRILPRHPGLIVLFGLLFVFAALPGPAVLVAMIVEQQFDAELFLILAALLVLSYKAGPILTMILLGYSRLALSREGLDYRVSVLGIAMRSQSGRVAISALDDITVGEPSKGGLEVKLKDGGSFYLRLPVGAGGLSHADLLRLRKRWIEDLGR